MDKDMFLEELRSQKEFLNARVIDAERQLAEVQEQLQSAQVDKQAWERTLSLYENNSLQVHVDQEPKAVRNRSYIFLQALGRPIHYTALFKFLTGMGVEIGGAEPQKNLLAHLSQDSRFKSFGEGRWGLADWTIELPAPPEGEAQ